MDTEKSIVNKDLSLNKLKNVDKNILALSSSILEQMEECNQFLYTTIDKLLSDELVFKVTVDIPTNTATAVIELKETSNIVEGKKTFTKEYDNITLGMANVPASIKLNKILIDTIKDLLTQLGI